MDNIFTYQRKYKLTKGYSVKFALDANDGPMAGLEAEWSPRVPPAKIVEGKFLEAYRNARNDFIESIGLKTLVIEH